MLYKPVEGVGTSAPRRGVDVDRIAAMTVGLFAGEVTLAAVLLMVNATSAILELITSAIFVVIGSSTDDVKDNDFILIPIVYLLKRP